jgi:hypothetical protein
VVHENRIAFTIDERSQGGTDLNGDGDIDDLVLHVFDVATETTTNVGLDVSDGFALGKEWVAFTVDEAKQGASGTDLNGDGDIDDLVLHVFDLQTGTITNVGLDARDGFEIGKEWIAFTVDEARQGGADLNEDNDTLDFVLHVFDVETRMATNVKLDASGGFALGKEWLAFAVDEDSQGGTDLNNDGDIFDLVLHVFDVKTGTTTRVGLASNVFALGKQWIAFAVDEDSQGSTDFNGDGDAADFVLHVYDLETGMITNVGLDASGGFAFGKEWLAFAVDEDSQGGTDFNGDGDAADQVLHVVDVKKGHGHQRHWLRSLQQLQSRRGSQHHRR